MEGFQMMKKIKKADRYVTFIPFNEETHLFIDDGIHFTSTNAKLLEYGADIKSYEGRTYYEYSADTPDKLKLFTNAYDLRYKALYQGEGFSAGVSSYPQIILFAGTFDYGASATTTIKGFEIEAGNWVKKVDISEVTLIPIKIPIDLSQYLPS